MKPALKTAGIAGGVPGASFVLGLVVSDLLGETIEWPRVGAKGLALALLLCWAWVTARHPEVETGILVFDKKNQEPEA